MAKNVTPAQFERIAMEQLTELWTLYGNYSEIWLDGGYPISMLPQVRERCQAGPTSDFCRCIPAGSCMGQCCCIFWANLIHFLPQMKQLLSTYQPSATAFNGLGVYDPHDDGTRLSNNSVRWIGAESGEPNADDIWSTATRDGLYSGDQSPT